MFNEFVPGTMMPIPRHMKSLEAVACLRGLLVDEFYDEQERICTEAVALSPDGQLLPSTYQ